jgi:hypothetical protein
MRISDVEGVDYPGSEFMRAVFTLDEGETGVAMNRPETNVYVVQVQKLDPPPKVLWEVFKAEDFKQYAYAAAEDVIKARDAWWETLQKDAGLEWKQQTQPIVAESRMEE